MATTAVFPVTTQTLREAAAEARRAVAELSRQLHTAPDLVIDGAMLSEADHDALVSALDDLAPRLTALAEVR